MKIAYSISYHKIFMSRYVICCPCRAALILSIITKALECKANSNLIYMHWQLSDETLFLTLPCDIIEYS